MAIQKIDRNAVTEIRQKLQDQLDSVAAELGVRIQVGNASYDGVGNMNVTYKVEVAVLDADGNVQDRAAVDFARDAALYGLKSDDLGTEFVCRGKTYRITGLQRRARKAPILAELVGTGKTYKFPAVTVKMLLATA